MESPVDTLNAVIVSPVETLESITILSVSSEDGLTTMIVSLLSSPSEVDIIVHASLLLEAPLSEELLHPVKINVTAEANKTAALLETEFLHLIKKPLD